MNSYGSVSWASHAIYKVLHYMNFFPVTTAPAPTQTAATIVDQPTIIVGVVDDIRITMPQQITTAE